LGLAYFCFWLKSYFQLYQFKCRTAYTSEFPIPKKAVQRSISKARNTYRNAVYANEWELLAKVYQAKAIENDGPYRNLLFNRCILEYSYLNEEGERKCWYDIHPLIKGIEEFQVAFNRLNA
jgi:hypothetical protein